MPSIAVYSIIAVLAIIGLTTQMPKRAGYTGDEPRYMYYALSLISEGKPMMSEQAYETFRARPLRNVRVASYPMSVLHGDDKVPKHPILLSILLAPFTASWPLQRLRLFPFLAGLTGLCFLGKLLIAQKMPLSAVLACLIPPALFLPALPYYFVALPEIFLFLLVCIAFWNMLGAPGDKLRAFWPSLLCGGLAPFVHLRGVPLTITVASYVAWRVARLPGNKISWLTLARIAGIYLSCALVAVLYNLAIYGNLFGSVSDARPKFNLENFAAVLFNFRHGLLSYAPIYVLSLAGLFAGLWQRKTWAFPAAIFLAGLIHVSVGPDPAECYPARFWVQGVPVLAICLIGFVQGAMPVAAKIAVYVLLSAVSAANSILFFFNPDIYMSARSAALPYDRLFEFAPWIHLGFWVNLLGSPSYQLIALCAIGACIVIVALASIYRSRLLAILTGIIIVAGFDIHRARPLNPVSRLDAGSLILKIDDQQVSDRAPIRLGLCAPWTGDCPEPTVAVSDGKYRWEDTGRSTVVLRRPDKWPVPLELRISGQSHTAYAADPAAVRVAINKSWLIKLW